VLCEMTYWSWPLV